MQQNPFPVLLFWHWVFIEGSYFNDHSHCQQCLLVTYLWMNVFYYKQLFVLIKEFILRKTYHNVGDLYR